MTANKKGAPIRVYTMTLLANEIRSTFHGSARGLFLPVRGILTTGQLQVGLGSDQTLLDVTEGFFISTPDPWFASVWRNLTGAPLSFTYWLVEDDSTLILHGLG